MVPSLVLEKSPILTPSITPILANGQNTTNFDLEDFLNHPPDNMEWVDGQLIAKTGMTKRHSVIQARLSRYWLNYLDASGQKGEVMTEAPCRTFKQVRRPDVAYMTAELAAEMGDFTVCDRPFSLIAEIVSPEDKAEELFAKAQEYLEAGCLEVWLLFPQVKLIMVKTDLNWSLFNANQVVSTQNILTGFTVLVEELLKVS